ncbi:MAG: AAA family ATPase [Planctomycetes bacterium]|nr:AAA family ATPase [Planctomycetota bacterium]
MQFNFNAVEAKREKVSVRVGLSSPTGGGKSYSALRLATGMCEEMGIDPKQNVLYLGTEQDRDLYYADKFSYKYVPLTAPYSPEMFQAAVEYGNNKGYKVIIIDSASHEWNGEGGILEIQSKMPGNSYVNWGKVKPRHKKFVDAMIKSDAHIICCMRSKMKHELSQEAGKKAEVKKVGMGVQGDSDLEYEMTVALSLEQDTHIFDASSKDNTGIFEGRNDILKEEDGRKLIQWANDGKTPEIVIGVTEVKSLKDTDPKMFAAFSSLDQAKLNEELKTRGYESIDGLVDATKETVLEIYNVVRA